MMTAEDRTLRRMLGSYVVFINSKGQPVKRAVFHMKPLEALRKERRKALEGCDAVVVLNELPYEDALTVYRRALAKMN
jgi:hypothetical protein